MERQVCTEKLEVLGFAYPNTLTSVIWMSYLPRHDCDLIMLARQPSPLITVSWTCRFHFIITPFIILANSEYCIAV